MPGVSVPQAVVAASGGSVMVPDGATGASIPPRSDDYGFGGFAMALFDFTGDGYDEVVFAPAFSPNQRAADRTSPAGEAYRGRGRNQRLG